MLNFTQKTSGETFNSGLPSRKWLHRDVRLLSPGGSPEMSVPGTPVAPSVFGAAPPPGEVWILDYSTLILIDPGDMLPLSFGSGAELVNGLEFFCTIEQLGDKKITEMKNNLDVLQCFSGALPGSVGAGSADPGFLETVDYVSGRMEFGSGFMVLKPNEFIGFKVKDDLSGIQNMRASLHYRVSIDDPGLGLL